MRVTQDGVPAEQTNKNLALGHTDRAQVAVVAVMHHQVTPGFLQISA